MIAEVLTTDLPDIRHLIDTTVRHSIPLPADDQHWLLAGIMESLERWEAEPDVFLHIKYVADEQIAGVLLLKDGWNLVNLFIDPAFQGQGIGRALVAAAAKHTRASNYDAIRLNSSDFAVDFYRRLGFVQMGPGKDRPGGCVPMELTL